MNKRTRSKSRKTIRKNSKIGGRGGVLHGRKNAKPFKFNMSFPKTKAFFKKLLKEKSYVYPSENSDESSDALLRGYSHDHLADERSAYGQKRKKKDKKKSKHNKTKHKKSKHNKTKHKKSKDIKRKSRSR
jgi:NAD+--asparagine ADP-ribosyltransferase